MTHSDDNLGDPRALAEEQELLDLLKDYPMPRAAAGFYDRALAYAVHEGARRQRNRWLMTGFGSAVAAGIVLFLLSGIFFSAPKAPDIDATIPGVTIALAEPQTVNLVFASAEPLDAATLTVMLPEGIELAGFPGQREISWETSLNAGKNLLPLKLIAVSAIGGEVLARLEHKDRNRTFRLRVEVS